jgi:hypothetical protein
VSQLVVPIVIALVLLVVAAAVVLVLRRRRSAELRSSFGPEYDRTVETTGKRRQAEKDLADRQARHAQLEIRPLTAASRQRYLTAWEGVQSRFVDRPVLALSEADTIVTQLLGERGFPTGDTRTSEEMLSVEHAHVLDSFRAGHAIEQANTSTRSDTEQVRQGMLHFRTVFEAMLQDVSPYPEQSTAAEPTRTQP